MSEPAVETARDPMAVLEEIRERQEQLRTKYGYVSGLLALANAKYDVPRLLAGYDALLKLAGEFEEKSARLHAACGADLDPSEVLPDRAWTGRAYACQEAAADIRSAIAAALSSEEPHDGR